MITKLKAITDSLIKWEHCINTGDRVDDTHRWLLKNYHEILEYNNCCGLCEKYFDVEDEDDSNPDQFCLICPLYKKWGKSCGTKIDLWSRWERSETIKERKKLARKIYNDIYSLLTDKQKEKFTK